MSIYVIYHTEDHKAFKKTFSDEKCWHGFLRLKLIVLKIY